MKNYFLHKKVGNLYLSQEEIDILEEFGIDYKKATSLSNLIFNIQSKNINDDVIENLLDVLTERNYYMKKNK